MPAETKLFSLLSGSSTITTVTSTRIYPMLIPQGVAAFPTLVYTRVSGHRIYDLNGYSGLENPHFAIDCWGSDYAMAKDLSTRVHNVMQTATGFKSVLLTDRDENDPELGLFCVTMEFSVWNQE